MADNKINATEREENLGSFKVNEAFNFKNAIREAKKHAVDCGIFADWYKKHPEDIKKKK